jgi:hypothetical protein
MRNSQVSKSTLSLGRLLFGLIVARQSKTMGLAPGSRSGLFWTIARLVLIGLLASFLHSEAPAEETIKSFVRGVGTSSCGDWITARRSGGAIGAVFTNWIDAYVTGFSVGVARARGVTYYDVARNVGGSAGLHVFVDNYCQVHPLDAVARAGSSLLIELMRKNPEPSQR